MRAAAIHNLQHGSPQTAAAFLERLSKYEVVIVFIVKLFVESMKNSVWTLIRFYVSGATDHFYVYGYFLCRKNPKDTDLTAQLIAAYSKFDPDKAQK